MKVFMILTAFISSTSSFAMSKGLPGNHDMCRSSVLKVLGITEEQASQKNGVNFQFTGTITKMDSADGLPSPVGKPCIAKIGYDQIVNSSGAVKGRFDVIFSGVDTVGLYTPGGTILADDASCSNASNTQISGSEQYTGGGWGDTNSAQASLAKNSDGTFTLEYTSGYVSGVSLPIPTSNSGTCVGTLTLSAKSDAQ